MSIQITDQVCMFFALGDWRRALKTLCSERITKAQKNLSEIDPQDSTGIAKLQEEIRQLDKFLCIEGAVLKFEESQAASKMLK